MLIGLGEDMTPYEFEFTRLKVKVTRVTCKHGFPLFLIIFKTIYHRAFIFHMLMILIDTWPLLTLSYLGQGQKNHVCKKKWLSLIILRTVHHRALIFYIPFCLGKGLTSINFLFFRSRAKAMGHFYKKCFPLIFFRTIYHRAFILHMLIGLGKVMTPTDCEFTRSKGKVTRIIFVVANRFTF